MKEISKMMSFMGRGNFKTLSLNSSSKGFSRKESAQSMES